MIYEKVKEIIKRETPKKKQAIITITAAVDVDPDSHISIEQQAMQAVMDADAEVNALDGLEYEDVIEVKAHE